MNGVSNTCPCRSWPCRKTALIPPGCPNLARCSPTSLCFEDASRPLRVKRALFIMGMMVFLAADWKSITRGELEADPVTLCAVSCVHSIEGVPLAKGSSMAVLKLQQDTEWHRRMVLLSCLDLSSTSEFSHRQGHLLEQETTALHHLRVQLAVGCVASWRDRSGSCRAAQKVFLWLHAVVQISTAATGQTSLLSQESGLKETSQFTAMIFTGPQNQFWFVNSSALVIFQQMQEFELGRKCVI